MGTTGTVGTDEGFGFRFGVGGLGEGEGEGGFSGAEDALDLAKLLCELYVSDADPEKEVGRVMEMFVDGLEGGGGDGG